MSDLRFLVIILLILSYGITGAFMEIHEVIVKPAWWALYGGSHGILITFLIMNNKGG